MGFASKIQREFLIWRQSCEKNLNYTAVLLKYFKLAMKLAPVLLLAFCLVHGPVSAEYAWPERVVKIEEMQPLAPIHIEVSRIRPRGVVRGPSVLRVHVNAQGLVQRAVLMQSCGSPAFDEAALHSIRGVTFKPYQLEEMAVDVTLVLPLHFPIPKNPWPHEPI
jgi:TonB family protein